MRALIQRVSRAAVEVERVCIGEIEGGLLILLGVRTGDTEAEAVQLAQKCAQLRIFEDDAGKMNRSLLDTGGAALVVSQFTLYADTRKGRRPSFGHAAPPAEAKRLYERFVQALRASGVSCSTGQFQAEMKVSLINDGPVTLMLECDAEGQGTG